MNITTTPETDLTKLAALRAQLAEKPSVVLEMFAAENGVSLQTVVECLPETSRVFAPGEFAEAVMADMADWGVVTVLVHTHDVILECKGNLPTGKTARGYYNLDHGSPIGGHFRLDQCTAMAFVRRPFMGSQSCSVSFFNRGGEAMFKVFVGRDENRELIASQVERFTVLQDRFRT
jgi:putative heme utilization carrier protein HutX